MGLSPGVLAMENIKITNKFTPVDLLAKIKENAGSLEPGDFRFSCGRVELDSMSSTGWTCTMSVSFEVPWENVHKNPLG